MSGFNATLLILAVLAQPWAPPSPGAPAIPDNDSELIELTALRASTEGHGRKSIDPALRGLSAIIETLPFDSFAPIAKEQKEAPYGRETLIPINGDYTLYIKPLERDREAGLVRLDARIVMLREGRSINALNTRAEAAIGQPLLFRGLELPNGELVIIMRLAQQDNESQGGGEASTQEPPEEQDQQEQQEEPPEEQQEENPPEDQQNEDSPPAPESAEMKPDEEKQDMQNIEAILQSLEEMDRREQQDLRNRRDHIDVRKGWW